MTATSSITLKVAEGRPQDTGRSLARLDPAELTRLGITPGAVVQIEGTRVTAARVMPTFRDLRGRQLVQIDGIIRSNGGAVIGEKVTLSVIEPAAAQRVVVAPEGTPGPRKLTDEQIGRALVDMPVVAGDRVRITALGSRFQEYRVLDTTPKAIVVIRPDTTVRLEAPGSPATPGRISYEDIGGRGPTIHRIREMVELPLRYPQVFSRLGIDPRKGVLLHGPPGCGKTRLARAVASETAASFISVSGPEIINRRYGASEARLRQVFDQAKKDAPTIVFLDEIDSIAPKREAVYGELETRVVAQRLALMDGLEARGQIIVIGATNLPNSLDPALRRPGRFDREIVIGIPDAAGRREILEIHTRGMPLTADVDIASLAAMTHGFTGADVAAWCREAAMASLRRVLPGMELESASVTDADLLEIEVGMPDFMAALGEVEPSALREVSVEVPDVDWEDVGGLQAVTQELREIVEWPIRHADLFEMDGVEDLRGVLVLAATNRVDMLDPALLRPGRFDRVIEIGPPDERDRLEILQVHAAGRPISQSVDLPALARVTKWYTGAGLSLCSFAQTRKCPLRIVERVLERLSFLCIPKSHVEYGVDARGESKLSARLVTRSVLRTTPLSPLEMLTMTRSVGRAPHTA